jgi:hypothetical protein
MANDTTKVRIRMYRQGLGDCFLLTFSPEKDPVHMLIDCGTLGTNATEVEMPEVIENIAEVTGKHLHLLVLTHEHKDHVSGFNTQRNNKKLFDNIQVERVWVAWTEDEKDDLAREVQRFKKDLLNSLRFSIQTLSQNKAPNEDEKKLLADAATATRELLLFDGAPPGDDNVLAADFAKTVHAAMSYASQRAGGLPVFLSPGRMIEPEWLPGWRFYVLGPPRDPKALNVLGDHDSPELYHFSRGLAADLASSADFHESKKHMASYRAQLDDPEARQQLETSLPFDVGFRIEEDKKAYEPLANSYKEQGWRNIDYDWLAASEDLALQLNNATNNTSLVLAMEWIKDGRVLLFPGDAQLGNWQSWEKVEFQVKNAKGETEKVTSKDLLRRTVFYKVGHHASHNATRKVNGLEEMKDNDLVAMIPVDTKVAENKKWVMPAGELYDVLLQKTRGRVLRSDTGWPGEKSSFWTQQEWDRIKNELDAMVEKPDAAQNGKSTVVIDRLYIDYCLR